ncbi:MAG: hypothetical protein ACOYKN_19140, partial [Pirellula sp.]
TAWITAQFFLSTVHCQFPMGHIRKKPISENFFGFRKKKGLGTALKNPRRAAYRLNTPRKMRFLA